MIDHDPSAYFDIEQPHQRGHIFEGFRQNVSIGVPVEVHFRKTQRIMGKRIEDRNQRVVDDFLPAQLICREIAVAGKDYLASVGHLLADRTTSRDQTSKAFSLCRSEGTI